MLIQRLYGLSDEQTEYQITDRTSFRNFLDIKSNRIKSQIRSRVEHVFGFIERSMGGLVFRGVGIIRAKAAVAMTNLTYNIARLVQIKRYHPDWLSLS